MSLNPNLMDIQVHLCENRWIIRDPYAITDIKNKSLQLS